MFKIAKTSTGTAFVSGTENVDVAEMEQLAQICVTESWNGDLSNGLFRLGEKAAAVHGLDQRECGLLNIIRCYEPGDRARVLELFEQAATASSSFCFSTTIHLADGGRQPIFCIGESTGLEQKYSGFLSGVFLFPRFRLHTTARRQ